MVDGSDALAYAQEVYAACATIGYAGAAVTRLKALLDDAARGGADGMEQQLVTAAQHAHLAAADWAQRGR